MHPSNPTDDPHFISRMRAALLRPPEPPVTGVLPEYHNVELAFRKGSPATSLNELPRPLVSALPGFGLRVLVGVVVALHRGPQQLAFVRFSISAWPRSSRCGWCATAGC